MKRNFSSFRLNPKSQTISAPAAVVAPVRPVFSNLLLAPTSRHFVRSAGLSGTLAIFLGVYGAHAMRENTPEELKRVKEMNAVFFVSFDIRFFFSYFKWHKITIYFIQLFYLLYH